MCDFEKEQEFFDYENYTDLDYYRESFSDPYCQGIVDSEINMIKNWIEKNIVTDPKSRERLKVKILILEEIKEANKPEKDDQKTA